MATPTLTKPAHRIGALVDVYVEQCNVTIPRGVVATSRTAKDGVVWYVINCQSVKVAARESDVTAHQPK